MAFHFLQTTNEKFHKNYKGKYLNYMTINVFAVTRRTARMNYILTTSYLRAKVVMRLSEIYNHFANDAGI